MSPFTGSLSQDTVARAMLLYQEAQEALKGKQQSSVLDSPTQTLAEQSVELVCLAEMTQNPLLGATLVGTEALEFPNEASCASQLRYPEAELSANENGGQWNPMSVLSLDLPLGQGRVAATVSRDEINEQMCEVPVDKDNSC